MNFNSRDPIHNFVTLPSDLAEVVNCQVLQRLRGIRQLAMASLVYHGALHTRFDHTLGVTHVSTLMAEQLGISGDELRLVQLAGLLHDAGHGPFSHVSETSLGWFADETKLKAGQSEHKIHELVTAEIIRTDPELSRFIPSKWREDVINLLGEWKGRPVLKQIISGPLDGDKQDYLLRDGFFCGVPYGNFDIRQLHRSLVLPNEDEQLMIEEHGIHAIEQFVLAKYYMTANVYRHRVRLISDAMITRAIRLGIVEDKLEPLTRLYRYDGTPQFVENYKKWDDARFMETFCPPDEKPPGVKSGAMLRRLRERKLLKLIYSERIGQPYDARCLEKMKALPKKKQAVLRRRIEEGIANFISGRSAEVRLTTESVDPDFVIANSYGIKSAKESSKNEDEGILVQMKPSPQYFVDQSILFKSINEAYSDNCIQIYAAVEWMDPSKKDEIRSVWQEPIRNLIQTECLKGKP
jgi:HD superfamily phosphohydrolase